MGTLAAMQFGFAPALANALLQALWQVTLLAAGAWFALAALARAGAALRHAVAMGFLVAMAVLPALTFLGFWRMPATRINEGWLPALTLPQVDATAGLFVQDSSPLALVLALCWVVGAALMLLRHAGGWRLISALDRRPFESLPADWQRRVERLGAAMRIGREVSVRLSKEVAGPFTARLLRPVIWLPLSLLTQLPREQLEALIAHELAHIARMDWLWNGLQCCIESLLFFHPAAWWLGRRIRAEREHASDDLAVAACGDAIALAEALAQLGRQRHSSPHLVLSAHGGALMQRITRLVSGPPARGRWGTRAGLAVLVAAGAVLAVQAGVSGMRPGLHIRSSTDGVLGPGDTREITAHGIEGERHYRASVDAQGQLSEAYTRDGQVRPIDAGVRTWLAEVARLSVPPAPPMPPAPPAPPRPFEAAAPPAPPAPPPPPEIADSAEFRSLLRVVAADRGVIARIGSPVAMASNDVAGRIDIDNAARAGDAQVRFDLVGPRGRASVRVVAALQAGAWTVETIEFTGPAR